MKKFVLNADDLGKSEFHNNAVIEGYREGFLKSASLMANMPYFEDAVKRVIKPNPNLAIGVHLNIIEGYALNKNLTTLCFKNGEFKNSYINILLKSNNKRFLKEVEMEFRSQIELVLEETTPSHIDSHVHTHSIPNIFNIVSKLADEYKIKQIRTQNEIPYFVKGKILLPQNIIKNILLNYFSLINKKTAKKYSLNTNDYLIGVCYTGMMNDKTIYEGLKKIKKENTVSEALIHPCLYFDNRQDNHGEELKITINRELEEKIKALGFINSNYMD